MTSVKIKDKELKVGQSCEFKDTFDSKISMGKIIEFRKMDEDSVWMKISNLEDARDTHWISLNVWSEQFLIEKEEIENESTEQENNEEYPF